jgi:outer membrane protein assembly factor BamB
MTQVLLGAPARPLRLWPGIVLASLILLLKLIVPMVAPQETPLGVLAGPLLGLAIGLWWLFFSRAPWTERIGVLLIAAVALLITQRFIDVTVATAMMGYMFPMYAIPIVAIALVVAAVATRRMAETPRRAALLAAIVIACGGWTLVRTGGFDGYFDQDFAWRWSKTPEQRLLAQANDEPLPAPKAAPAAAPAPAVETAPSAAAKIEAAPSAPPPAGSVAPVVAWAGFRGASRDGIVRGVTIPTDWATAPPVELWRRPIGPGWGSFAVRGDLIYTQEQRGDEEIVSAYDVKTGKPAWRHRDAARFWESNAGAGPRATPTVANDRVYTLGATGLVNALDADTGAVVWSHNAAADTGAKTPDWGFSASPLLVDGLVVIATSGVLVAYDAGTGERRWIGPAGADSYVSPQLMTIDGVRQIVHLNGTGLTAVSPTDGKPLWQYEWKGYPIVQPSQTPDGGILIAINESSGVRRLAVTRAGDGWNVEERWTSNRLKPYFNDFVVHKGHAYGFDGTILACIDLADGARKWKGGRYGGGQLVLLADQDLLLVISEEGDLALVSATPDEFKELGHVAAITGKTWNHPVVAGDVLLVRNGEEMATFRLARK